MEASFVSTDLICKGSIAGEQDKPGKTVALNVITKRGRVEDLLHLTVREKRPMMKGAIEFRTRMVIPPGKADILDKLKLQGSFGISAAHFNNSTIQRRIQELSERARGISKKRAEEELTGNDCFQLSWEIQSGRRISPLFRVVF